MSRDSRRESLEKRLSALTDEYRDLSTEIANEIDLMRKGKYKRRLDEVAHEMDSVESELDMLEIGIGSGHERSQLQSKLCEIDFRLLEQAIRRTLLDQGDGETDDGRAVLLLFQQSTKMGGKWCAERVRKLLLRESIDGLFRHIPIEFQFSDHVNRVSFLNRMGKYLEVESDSQDLAGLSKLVIQKLCCSLQSGSVVMIECNGCDDLSLEPGMFRWLVEEFWRNMLRKISEVSKNYYEIRVVVLLFFNDSLPEGNLLANHCCTLERFEREKILEIPLSEWTQKDIGEWIAKYSGLRLHRSEVDRVADKIYKPTDGLPTLVAHELLNEFCLKTTDDLSIREND